jgi:hypothetical protein
LSTPLAQVLQVLQVLQALQAPVPVVSIGCGTPKTLRAATAGSAAVAIAPQCCSLY